MSLFSIKTTNKPIFLAVLALMYADLGTSPLYTLKVSMAMMGSSGSQHVIGLLSLLFWLMMVVVTFKYVFLMLKVDNRGEGGVLALLELAVRGMTGRRRTALVIIGLMGVCLLYGDSVITPALSIVSALEGLEKISPALGHWVFPVSVLLMALLFVLQARGMMNFARWFGHIMLAWFIVLALLGVWHIAQYPQVLIALDPRYAMQFIMSAPWQVFLLLGAVVLSVTGAHVLYEDMGYWGRSRIQHVWFYVALPALVLCYLGQGAVILTNPQAAEQPFFSMVPSSLLWPVVALAVCAALIASHTVINGVFSMTRQAIQLGYWPRMSVLHASDNTLGAAYLPKVNRILALAVIGVMLWFDGSSELAGVYGVAYTGAMLVTSVLVVHLLFGRVQLRWRRLMLLSGGMLVVLDTVLFASALFKIPDGGWITVCMAFMLWLLMLTWSKGSERVRQQLAADQQPLEPFMQALDQYPPVRVAGTAIFISLIPDVVPSAFLHNLKHNKVLHEQTIFLTLVGTDVPYVSFQDSFTVRALTPNSWQITGHWGFKQEPDSPRFLAQVAMRHSELDLEPMRVSYFLSRQSIIVPARTSLVVALFRRLYVLMARNADKNTRFYRIPPNSVVEMGTQIEL